MSGGSGSSGLSCFSCLARLCVTKNDSGQVTGLSFRDDDGILVDVPACGSGSGSGGTIESACCTAGLLPGTLYLNFSDASSGLVCLNGLSLACFYVDDTLGWGNGGAGPFPCSEDAQIARFACQTEQWHVTYGAPGGCAGLAIVTAGSCLGNIVAAGTMDFSAGSSCGDNNPGTAAFTISKTPP
jgi:hypothetical protein